MPSAAPYRQGTPYQSDLGPDDSASQVAWAKRQQIPKRGLTRKVKLTRGNWIVDHRVPTAVKNSIEPKWSQGECIQSGLTLRHLCGRTHASARLPAGTRTNEFTHMRYTAATCDPDEFTVENGWSLRTSAQYGRDTELLIAIT